MLEGETYTIKARVWSTEIEGTHTSDTDSYGVTVYESVVDIGYKIHDVFGTSAVFRQYYSHPYVDLDCWVYAWNPGNENNYSRKVYHKVIHKVTRPDGTIREPGDATAETDLPVGQTYVAAPSGLAVHVGPGDEDDLIRSTSYVRLVVKGDVMKTTSTRHKYRDRDVEDSWFVGKTLTFTYKVD